MDDSSTPKKGGIPSWQRGFSEQQDTRPQTPAIVDQVKPAATDISTDDLSLEQAVKFLRKAQIKNSSLEQKVSFLESKGIKKEDIDQAIAIVNTDAQLSESSKPATPRAQELSITPERTATASEAASPPSIPPRDAPPIITYPEYLLHVNKPAPLITVSRLLNTAYIASGIAAAIYGTSKFLITPMTDTLTDARHDFALHTLSRIEELNSRMRDTISKGPRHDPSLARQTIIKDGADDIADSEADTAASDPTELFHRDFGTQTSPGLDEASINVHDESTSSSDDALRPHSDDPISYQEQKLKELHSLFADLLEESQSNGATADDISEHISALQTYLDDLQYPSHLWSGNQYNQYGGFGPPDAKKEDDEISRVKAEIRGVKGFFLSARNFPGAARAPRPPVSSYG